MRKKELTIIIPFLNEGIEVENTLESIFSHSNNDVMIIVINDASDDGFDYESVMSNYPIVYVKNENRMGVAASRDLGVKLCETQYFLLLDAHMRFYSNNWVERIVEELEKDSKVFLCCQTIALRKKDNEIIKRLYGNHFLGAYIRFNDFFRFLEPEWAYQSDDCAIVKKTIDISCVLGAGYACSKKYWEFLKGLQGLLLYGSDEPLISLKVWLTGGKCKLLNDVAIGHIYRLDSPYSHDSVSRVYNRLYITFLLFPTNFRKKVFSIEKFKSLATFNEANHLLLNKIDENLNMKAYLSSITVKKFSNFKSFNDDKDPKLNTLSDKKKNYYLTEITTSLISNFTKTADLGVVNGKMSIIIFLFHYAKYTDNTVFFKIAEKYLENICQEISKNTPYNFASGLAGIGWGIEYLTQNKLIEVTTEEFLHEIDKRIMEISPLRMDDLNIFYGMGGIVRYILSRLYTKNKSNPFEESYLLEVYTLSKKIIDHKIDTDSIDLYIEFILYYESKLPIDISSIYDVDFPRILNKKNEKSYKRKFLKSTIEIREMVGIGLELIFSLN